MALIDDVKLALRIDGNDMDAEIERLIQGATREYLQYTTGSIDAGTTSVEVPDDAVNGIILMVRADYDADPIKRDQYRKAAETLWHPYKTYDWTVV